MRFLSKWRVLRQCSSLGMVRYTTKARRVVFCACEYAMEQMSSAVTPEHLLMGLIQEDQSLTFRLGLPTIDLIRSRLRRIPLAESAATGRPLVLSPAARQVILTAAEEREHFCHKHTGSEHLLLGIIKSGSDAARILGEQGLTIETVRQLIIKKLQPGSGYRFRVTGSAADLSNNLDMIN